MKIKFIQTLIDIIRGKKNKNNIINNIGNNIISYDKNDKSFFQFNVIGENNTIKIKKLAKNNLGKLIINLYGNDNEILIDENLFIGTNLSINLGQDHPFQGKIKNSVFKIGKNCRVEDVISTSYNSNTKIIIGNNCLFSLKVIIYNTDGHPIYDLKTHNICNHVNNIIIGDNCWIGYNSTILKNVQIKNNTIVGWGSVVSKSFNEENIAIAGNPAKIVKRDISWKISDPEYIKNKNKELINE